MAGPFDFTSPGAAFGDALTNALVERKAQERQNLINSLGVKAEQRADTEAQQMGQVRAQQIAEGQQRAEQQRAQVLSNPLHIGADLDQVGMSDADKQLMVRQNLATSKQVPDPSATPPVGPDGQPQMDANGQPLPPPMKTVYTYTGDYAKQEHEKRVAATQQMIARQPDAHAKQFLQDAADANGGELTAQDVMQTLPHHIAVVNFEGKTPTINGQPIDQNTTLPFGTESVVKPYRPVVPKYIPDSANQYLSYDYDKDGNKVTHVYGQAHGEHLYDIPGWGEKPGQAPPRQTTPSSVKYTPQAATAYTNVLRAFQQDPSTNANAMRDNAVNLVRAASGTTDRVKNAAIALIQDPAKAQNISTDGWTPLELQQLDELRNSIWPQDVSDAYHANAKPIAKPGSTIGNIMSHVWGGSNPGEPQ